VHDREVHRVARDVLPDAPLHARPQRDEFSDRGLDDLRPPLQWQRKVAAGWVEVQVEPVLARLRLRYLLEPERRAQPGRVEDPVLERRLLTQPGAVEPVPGVSGSAGVTGR
jgi:hypothetical protein